MKVVWEYCSVIEGNKNMMISVIIPLYKGKKYIKKIIDMSAAWKTAGVELEIIFVNDYPEEALYDEDYENHSAALIQIHNNECNVGIHESRIIGCSIAKGNYIVFLDQDDTLMQDYMNLQLNNIGDREAVICNGYWREGELIFSQSNQLKGNYNFERYLNEGYPVVSLGQLMIKRQAIPNEWLTNPLKHNGCDDLYLWVLMMLYGVKVSVNNVPVYIHEEDGSNSSLNYKEMSLSIQDVRDRILKLKFMDEKSRVALDKKMLEKISKYDMYEKLNRIIEITQRQDVEKRLLEKEIKKIAIYGVGLYGKWLLNILKDSNINIEYAIDSRADVKDIGIPVIQPEKTGGSVDAIIVTPVFDYGSIRNKIKEKYSCRIMSIEEIL